MTVVKRALSKQSALRKCISVDTCRYRDPSPCFSSSSSPPPPSSDRCIRTAGSTRTRSAACSSLARNWCCGVFAGVVVAPRRRHRRHSSTRPCAWRGGDGGCDSEERLKMWERLQRHPTSYSEVAVAVGNDPPQIPC